MAYSRISADCHIALPWTPPDLFTANASAAMKARMPFVTDGPDGPFWTSQNGQNFGLMGGVGPAGQTYVPGTHYRVDVMASTGLYDDGETTRSGSSGSRACRSATSVQGDIPVRSHRHQAHRRHGRRDAGGARTIRTATGSGRNRRSTSKNSSATCRRTSRTRSRARTPGSSTA